MIGDNIFGGIGRIKFFNYGRSLDEELIHKQALEFRTCLFGLRSESVRRQVAILEQEEKLCRLELDNPIN